MIPELGVTILSGLRCLGGIVQPGRTRDVEYDSREMTWGTSTPHPEQRMKNELTDAVP